MDCTRCGQALHPDGYYCHHCGQPAQVPRTLGLGRTLLGLFLAAVSFPMLLFGGCFTVAGQAILGLPLAGLGLVGLHWLWKLIR